MALCAFRAAYNLTAFDALRFQDILRNLPGIGNARVIPISAVQSFDLVLFRWKTFDQRSKKISGGQNPAAINAINLL